MKALRVVLTIGILLTLANDAVARYRPLSVRKLFTEAGLVVVGTIREVNSDTFSFAISQVVLAREGVSAPQKGEQLQIVQFSDWTCAHRWTRYEPSQSALLFLQRRGTDQWAVMGAGDEGEMPIFKGQVFVDADVARLMDDWRPYGAPFLGGRFTIAYVNDSVLRKGDLRTSAAMRLPSDKALRAEGASRRR